MRRENTDTLRRLRAAITRGLRPTCLVRRVQPHSSWDDLDFDLFEAFDYLERDTSGSNGLPRWLTQSGSPDVAFQVETVEDAADVALDKWDEAHQGKKRKPGTVRFVVPRAVGEGAIEGGVAREAMLLERARQLQDAEAPDDDDVPVERKRPPGGYDVAAYG